MADSRTIPRFVRRLRDGHRWWNLGLTAAGHALVAGVVLCLVDLLAPRQLGWAALAAAVWLVAVCLWTAARLRAPMRHADRELGLRDRLLTYLGLQRAKAGAAASPAFAAWLEEDLEQRLAAIPDSVATGLWRRPLGRLRYLVPLLVLFLLLREFAPLPVRPDDRGPSLSMGGGGEGGGGEASSEDGGSNEGEAEQQPDQQPPEPEQQPEQEPPPPDAPGQPEESSVPAEPPPELEVDVVDHFVIPQFIGEGETRKQMAKLALLGEGESGKSAPVPKDLGAPDAPPPPREIEKYEKAYERALRSRHVPVEERPFVKKYFEALLEAVR